MRRQLPDGPEAWCTNGAAAVAMWRETLPPGACHRAAERLREGDTVLDIGGNIGLMPVYCALLRPGIRVVAAEPAPALHTCLERNLAEHAGTRRHTECAAVTDRPGRLRFTYYPQAPGNSGPHADRKADDDITLAFLRNSGIAAESVEGLDEGVGFTVPALTVSDPPRLHSVERVDLLKVDVERAGLEVLHGVEDHQWPLVCAVVAEVHDEAGRLAAVQALLQARGFEVRARQDRLLVGTSLYDVEAVRPV